MDEKAKKAFAKFSRHKMWAQTVRFFECPSCGAAKGQWCQRAEEAAGETYEPHPERLRVMRDAWTVQ